MALTQTQIPDSELESAVHPASLLPDYFSQAASRHPDAIAIEIPPGIDRTSRITVSYRALDTDSARLSTVIGPLLKTSLIVALLFPRDDRNLYVSQLAALRAGAAFVSIEPSFPDDQIHSILRDAEPDVILTNHAGSVRLSVMDLEIPILQPVDFLCAPNDAKFAEPLAVDLSPETLAYLIYTSGTTGRPKGVMISHAGIANLVGSDLNEFRLGPGDRVAQGSSAAYDSSVEEIWLALASGATVVVMDDDVARSGPDLIEWLQSERISVLCPPPTLLRSTGCERPDLDLPNLRLLYVGGEALTDDVVERWAPGRRLVNGYGPTECTVTTTRADVVVGDPITIGRPVPGMRAWVLDDKLEQVTQGEAGELCMSGVGLALGYHNLPEVTESKFPSHPIFGRIYRTGDLVQEAPDGNLLYLGRIDSQVKLRGYRIELEAIESCLVRCTGVREAVCRVQGSGEHQMLAAYIVPADTAHIPVESVLKAELERQLPPYMVPSLFGVLPILPKSVGGKVRRDALPELHLHTRDKERKPAQGKIEPHLAELFAAVLGLNEPTSADDDFFTDLGGTSLQAARLISLARCNADISSLTVRDLYTARTVERLAQRARPAVEDQALPAEETDRRLHSSLLAGLIQSLWLALEASLGGCLFYVLAYTVFPHVISHLTPTSLLLLSVPIALLCLAVYTPLAVLIAVAVKRALIGQYVPSRVPVYGSLYVRNWIVCQAVRIVPWRFLVGTELQNIALRALGANIGKRVHIHRGVNLLQGGWDLLFLGDDVNINQDAMVRIVDLVNGEIIFGKVELDKGACIEVRGNVGPGCRIGENATLGALSSLTDGTTIPCGERWCGVPANYSGRTAPFGLNAPNRQLAPITHATVLIALECLLICFIGLPVECAALVMWERLGIDIESFESVSKSLTAGRLDVVCGLIFLLSIVAPLTVTLEALAIRLLAPPKVGPVSVWSFRYLRMWLQTGILDSASDWLSGTLYWPLWLRAVGMKLGRGCEISTIIDVIPGLVSIGDETFFADGIYLGGASIRHGVVDIARTSIGCRTFFGNHAVIPAGSSLPDDVLLGVCTVAVQTQIQPNTSWFGLPAFELPVREIIECDRSLTHNPGLVRYFNRLLWETLRFALPVAALPLLACWYQLVGTIEALRQPWYCLYPEISLATIVVSLLPCLVILALKWLLIGRVKPGTHVFWSCWCSRWDFLYVAWGLLANGLLASLEGTPMLNVYLRAMGVKLGKGVILGAGFSHVVDPDMIEIGDYSTVSAMYQAHTFEDRVLKIDSVKVGKHATLSSGTVPLYGAVVGDAAYVGPNSVIMKHERLLPGKRYEGAPTGLDLSGSSPEVNSNSFST